MWSRARARLWHGSGTRWQTSLAAKLVGGKVRQQAGDCAPSTFTRVRAVAASFAVIGLAASGSVASWTNGEFAGAEFLSGTFSLASRTDSGEFVAHGSGNPATLTWSSERLFPGVSTASWVQIQSAGSVSGEVALSEASVEPTVLPDSAAAALRDALRVRVSVTHSTNPALPDCTPQTPGVEVAGLLNIPDIPAQPIEAAGASTVTYCLVLTLPLDAPAAAQGAILTPTWKFSGSSR